jgi:predicted AAA+ superfamily ATPase
MVESQVVNTLGANSFWKNGNEIDIVHNNLPIDVKYQEKINSEDFKPLREFMKKFSKREALLITKNEENLVKFEEGTIRLISAWKWLLEN